MLGSMLQLPDCAYVVNNKVVGLRIPFGRCPEQVLRLKLANYPLVSRYHVPGMPVKEVRACSNLLLECLYYVDHATVRIVDDH